MEHCFQNSGSPVSFLIDWWFDADSFPQKMIQEFFNARALFCCLSTTVASLISIDASEVLQFACAKVAGYFREYPPCPSRKCRRQDLLGRLFFLRERTFVSIFVSAENQQDYAGDFLSSKAVRSLGGKAQTHRVLATGGAIYRLDRED